MFINQYFYMLYLSELKNHFKKNNKNMMQNNFLAGTNHKILTSKRNVVLVKSDSGNLITDIDFYGIISSASQLINIRAKPRSIC